MGMTSVDRYYSAYCRIWSDQSASLSRYRSATSRMTICGFSSAIRLKSTLKSETYTTLEKCSEVNGCNPLKKESRKITAVGRLASGITVIICPLGGFFNPRDGFSKRACKAMNGSLISPFKVNQFSQISGGNLFNLVKIRNGMRIQNGK